MINLINSLDKANNLMTKSLFEIEFVSKSFREIKKKKKINY